jgi:hypothetical protein
MIYVDFAVVGWSVQFPAMQVRSPDCDNVLKRLDLWEEEQL